MRMRRQPLSELLFELCIFNYSVAGPIGTYYSEPMLWFRLVCSCNVPIRTLTCNRNSRTLSRSCMCLGSYEFFHGFGHLVVTYIIVYVSTEISNYQLPMFLVVRNLAWLMKWEQHAFFLWYVSITGKMNGYLNIASMLIAYSCTCTFYLGWTNFNYKCA